MSALRFRTDTQGRNAFAPAASPNLQSVSIDSKGNATFTVPNLGDGVQIVAAFCYPNGGEIWMSVNGTAAAPAGNTPADTESFANYAQLNVVTGDTINCFNNSSSSQNIGVAYYVGA